MTILQKTSINTLERGGKGGTDGGVAGKDKYSSNITFFADDDNFK